MTTTHSRLLTCVACCSMLLACAGTEDPEPCEPGDGVICTFMGNGTAGLGRDGVAPTQVSLYLPQDLTVVPSGEVYVLDWNNHRVRTIDENGEVATVIGTGELGDAPEGPGLEASLNHPTHLTPDPEGRLILAAWHNSKVMRWDPATGMLQNLCGTGARDYGGDGGPATEAVLDLPVATAFDAQGRMLIMDQANQRIRRIDDDGTIVTVVGPDAEFLPVPAGYERVCGPDAEGVERCKLCSPETAEDPMCAPRKAQGFAGDGEDGSLAVMFQPFSQSAPPAGRIAFSTLDDTLYFVDTGNHRIRAYYADGTVDTVAGSGPPEYDKDFRGGFDGDGGEATAALLKNPTDVAVDAGGNLFIADTANSCVRHVDTEGTITTVAGQCENNGFAGDGGDAKDARLDRPYGVALDGEGNLLIADTHNHRIRIVYGVAVP